jgi:hypothetical protein
MSKTYKRFDQTDKADKGKKVFKQQLKDQTTKQALTQYQQSGFANSTFC